MQIINGTVFTNGTNFENVTVTIEEERISALQPKSETKLPEAKMSAGTDNCPQSDIYDAEGFYVVPGFTDIHFHGCFGYDFSDHDLDQLRIMGNYELQNGITQICPAAMTYPEERLCRIIRCATAYQTDPNTEVINSCGNNSTMQGADLVGVNLEGPFISMAKKGAQNPEYIMPSDVSMFYRLNALAPGLLKLITVAPETEGALDFIEKVKDDITVSLGHTQANYDIAKDAFFRGARHVTHLFNAMPPLSHRDPGVIGAAFDAPDSHVELICDGIHISDSMIRATFQLFTEDRVVLISDSMMAASLDDGAYALGGQPVTVKGNLATLSDGTIAGSVTNLMKCFRHAVSIGIPLTSALKAATVNPARSIGIDKDYGTIAQNKIANLLILDRDLTVKDIIFHGRLL